MIRITAEVKARQSEGESQRQLHLPRWAAGIELSKGRTDLPALWIESGCSIESAELRVVERVVCFGAKLQAERFPDWEVLDHR